MTAAVWSFGFRLIPKLSELKSVGPHFEAFVQLPKIRSVPKESCGDQYEMSELAVDWPKHTDKLPANRPHLYILSVFDCDANWDRSLCFISLGKESRCRRHLSRLPAPQWSGSPSKLCAQLRTWCLLRLFSFSPPCLTHSLPSLISDKVKSIAHSYPPLSPW